MPRPGIFTPRNHDPERAQLVQAYMVLNSQQTSVRRRMSLPPLSPPLPTTSSATSSASSSPTPETAQLAGHVASSSPTGRTSRTTSPHSPASKAQRYAFLRRPSVPCIPELPEPGDEDVDHDHVKLLDINRRIKATLTDLLNCESVKHDARMRQWVQTRLLDAQHSMNERRRLDATAHHRRISSADAAPSWPWYDSPAHSTDSDSSSESERARKLSM